jgi:signal transduction histidine kinase
MSVEFSAEGPEGPGDSAGSDGPDSSAGPDGSEQRSYGARVERTAYRVVQEALTNVHKHAPGARTRVRLARRAGEVAVQVENGRPDEDAAEGATACPGLPSGGNGLVGMAERVNALGGGFVSGATGEGGFRVSAVIPAQRTEDGEKA